MKKTIIIYLILTTGILSAFEISGTVSIGDQPFAGAVIEEFDGPGRTISGEDGRYTIDIRDSDGFLRVYFEDFIEIVPVEKRQNIDLSLSQGSWYGGSGGCFPAGTLVHLRGKTVPVQEIRPGDEVLSRNPQNGLWDYKTVKGVFVQDYRGDFVTLTTPNGRTRATGNHPFLVLRGDSLTRRPFPSDLDGVENSADLPDGSRWVEARSLRTGDRLAGAENTPVELTGTEISRDSAAVYNLEVAGWNVYAVGAEGLAVHNKGQAEAVPEMSAPAYHAIEALAKPAPDSAGSRVAEEPEYNTENYAPRPESGFVRVENSPLSTFAIDVDTASYSNIRRFLNASQLPPPDSVKTEEILNYFDYDYPAPGGNDPLSITTETGTAPWNNDHQLLHVGLQARNLAEGELPPGNLVFLIDVSGSMSDQNKLPLLKGSFSLLAERLRPDDTVSIVVYAGAAGLVLPPTPGTEKKTIMRSLNQLSSGGSTAGGEGIRLAYNVARENFIPGGNNRVIIATDGDFNVGESSSGAIERLITREKESGIFLTCLGFGMGNYKDSKMEILADRGNGFHAYIDSLQEAVKLFVYDLRGTLYTVAKDVKVQVEFNPAKVAAYRLVGYENRRLTAEEFRDDQVDAGEMGSGHSVTALYEIIPAGSDSPFLPAAGESRYTAENPPLLAYDEELAFVRFRYKQPDGDTAMELSHPVRIPKAGDSPSENYRFSAAAAIFGMLLNGSDFLADGSMEQVISLAGSSLSEDPYGYRAEFLRLAEIVRGLMIIYNE